MSLLFAVSKIAHTRARHDNNRQSLQAPRAHCFQGSIHIVSASLRIDLMTSFVSSRPMARAWSKQAKPAPAAPAPPQQFQRNAVNSVRSGKIRSPVVAHAAPQVSNVQVSSPEVATLSEEELIQLTKDFVTAGFGGAGDGSNLSEDFIFRGPVIGPLPKSQYMTAVSSFKVPDAFPDIETKGFGYSIDPTDPYRVWFFTQTTGTHTGNMSFSSVTLPPTGNKIQNGTEANSVIWTPDRKVKYVSVGYCVDRINSNTPNGTMKVAVAGFMRTAGKPGLWDFAISPTVNRVTDFVRKLRGKPTNEVPFEELPAWWREVPDGNLRGPENYTK